MKIKPRIIIGLGNPGREYKDTYHNAGFLAVDFFAKNSSISNFSRSAGSRTAGQFLISKPLKSNVFMNESGKFVAKIMKKTGVKPEEILVIHDDSDIELGKFKFSFGRGAAGHKGVQSIIDELKTSAKGGSASGGKNFWRLRIGIRKTKRKKAGEMVLKKITPADKLVLERLFSDLRIL